LVLRSGVPPFRFADLSPTLIVVFVVLLNGRKAQTRGLRFLVS
jgi:uncharacterized protein YggT (Ycf19 family)